MSVKGDLESKYVDKLDEWRENLDTRTIGGV
jgi:hypothetical protein